ncbi:DUF2817 domain-containing protein [Tamlana fucoidanivorans]|uniref:DUF2817 domain-containing protein n=1 Tax=Allotamlana fucoidanivorans TaxID=2583814 RepID=A0A5C4SSF2_9FLAO|nr:M14 family zinc carboxypeptidase [Tamlana fucoidanivorans]TNJ46483.1 DUF2817 domain-containing protein [Tamlana fucoidanivorans]
MTTAVIKSLYKEYKAAQLTHRYITLTHIEPLLHTFKNKVTISTLGTSVLGQAIYGLEVGTGPKRILMWSQMHGNESTTTKALFDLLNTLLSETNALDSILKNCTLFIIPMLNPDGASAYTRVNANQVDLNRDAQHLSQPESKVLRQVFNQFKPHYCYNLHGQRTIFSAGRANKSAIVSFLSPAQDENCTVTPTRQIAMEIIAEMNKTLQELIPNHVGVYDDAFNINCVGDTFQTENIPTILFEAGHYPNDYAREQTRELIYIAYISSLNYIAHNEVYGTNYQAYFDIPENEKCFYDIVIRGAKVGQEIKDIGIQYKETIEQGKIRFIPVIEKIDDLNGIYGHKEIDAQGFEVYNEQGYPLTVSSENVFVILNHEKILLESK